MVAAVIFDAFGTLVEIRNRQNPYRRLLRLGSQQGRAASPNDIRWIMTHGHGIEGTTAAFGIKVSPCQLADLQSAPAKRRVGSSTLCRVHLLGKRIGWDVTSRNRGMECIK